MEAYSYLARVYDQLMDVDYDCWYAYLRNLIADRFEGGRLLDAACGTGQFAVRFARDGWQVVGVDRSAEMLNQAWQRKQRGLDLELVQQDLRSLNLGMRFDVIVCACDGVNYLCTEKDLASALQGFYTHLQPGGLLLFDISSRYKLSQVLGDNVFADETDDCAYIWRNYWDSERSLAHMELTLFFREQNGWYRRFTEEHQQRGWTVAELQGQLKRTGFRSIKVYEAFGKRPPRCTSERLQFIAGRED